MSGKTMLIIKIAIIIATLIVVAVELCSCTTDKYIDGTKVATFDNKDGMIPEKIICTDETYYALVEKYGSGHNYEIHKGSNMDSMEAIYKAGDNASSWFIDADKDLVAWGELTDTSYEIKAYSENDKKVKTIYHTESMDDISQNVRVYDDCVYYVVNDSDNAKAYIGRYDSKTGESDAVENTTIKYSGDNPIQCMGLDSGVVTFASGSEGNVSIKAIDIDENDSYEYKERDIKTVTSDDVNWVYAIGFDKQTESIGLYFQDKDQVDWIGYIEKEYDDVWLLGDMDENYYAYHDQIVCGNGVILYVEQKNVSGDILEHYRLCGYDIDSEGKFKYSAFSYAVTNKDKMLVTAWNDDITSCSVYECTIEE